MIHGHFYENSIFNWIFSVCNSLNEADSECGIVVISMARNVFDVIDEKDGAYNSTISGLVSAGRLCQAESLFDEMPKRDEVSQYWMGM